MDKGLTPDEIKATFAKIEVPQFSQNLEVNPEIQYIPREILMTDKGNVLRLLNIFGRDILHNKAFGFCVWNGKHWQMDARHLIHKKVSDVHEVMIEEIEAQTSKKATKDMADWVKQSNNQSRINAVINYIAEQIQTDIELFDQDDWVINCQNGTLDLRKSELRAFKRSDYITKILPYEYDSDAECPRWEQFLTEVLDPTEISWVQRVIGYSLTGDASAQMFMFLSGVGRNGKGILLQTLLKVLGNYGESLPPNSIMEKYGDTGIPNDIAKLKGARLIIVPEVPQNKRWNEELLKQLTGEDMVTARFLNKEFFSFKCKGKIWISGNNQPEVTDSGISFWKRLKLLPFKKTFDKNPDLNLAKELEAEIPGIFNWALRGLEAALKPGLLEGIKEPETVLKETEWYRSDTDGISQFVEEKCDKNDLFSAYGGELYTEYKSWMSAHGETKEMLNQTKFAKKLASRYPRQRDSKGFKYAGLTLKPKPATPTQNDTQTPKTEELPPINSRESDEDVPHF